MIRHFFKHRPWVAFFLIGWAGILVLMGIVASFQLFIPLSWLQFSRPHYSSLTIPYGMSSATIGRQLEDQGIIQSELWFRVYGKLLGVDKRLKAGFFEVDSGLSLHAILRIISRPPASGNLVRVTVPEGTQLSQIGAILEKGGLADKTEFVKFARKGKPIFIHKYPFLEQVPTDNLEGYLFPDTYFFPKGVDISIIVDLLLSQFQQKIVKTWDNSDSRIKAKYSFHQVVTLASIIEEEAEKQSEMPVIASVFFNRMDKGMQIASDPTVIYGLGFVTKAIVTYSDVTIHSPYNTYRYKGLPPTPISCPGVLAFQAVLQPAKTPYLFFVADKQGGHHFTRTYREHLAVQNGGH
jgi:UPF0755 protein